MTDNESTKQTFNDPWWPGIAIFGITFIVMLYNVILAASLGLMLLFLNWFRMGKARKVYLVFLLSVLVAVLWLFTDYDRSDVQILDKWEPLSTVGHITLLIAGIGILALIGGNDIRKYREQMEEPKQVSKWAGLSILLFLFSSYLVTWIGLELLFQQMGYCKFPTIYDLIAESQEAHVEGFGGLLARRKDLGCGWRWNNEASPVTNFNLPGERKFLDGIYNDDQYYHIEQIVVDGDLYDPSALDSLPSFEGEVMSINIQGIPQADFYESNCVGDGIIVECTLVVGFDHLVYGLDIRGMMFSDPDHFETAINTILKSAVGRILEYENSLP